jgi:hypothetical protein
MPCGLGQLAPQVPDQNRHLLELEVANMAAWGVRTQSPYILAARLHHATVLFIDFFFTFGFFDAPWFCFVFFIVLIDTCSLRVHISIFLPAYTH